MYPETHPNLYIVIIIIIIIIQFSPVELRVDEERNAQDMHLYLRHLACTYANTDTPLADLEQAIEHDFNMPPVHMKGQLGALKKSLLESKSAFDKVIADVMVEEPDFEQQIQKIRPVKNKKLKQDTDDVKLLFQHAAECQAKLGTFLTDNWGDCAVVPLTKAMESATRKVRDSYDGDWSKMRDISRATLKTPTFQQIYEAYKALQQEAWVEIVQVKNKYLTPNFMGYRDINMNLRVTLSDGSRHICELQMHLEQVLEIKNTVNHRCYEEVRVILPKLCAGVQDANGKAIDGDALAKDIIGRLDSSSIEMVVEKLEAKAGGLFQYAKLLEDQLKKFEGKKIDFDTVLELPSGLDDMYRTNFERAFPDGKGWGECSMVIAMICAAQEPLPVGLVKSIVGETGFAAASENMSLLFPIGRDRKLRVTHKSVVDWLKSEDNDNIYIVTPEQIQHAHAQLGDMCLRTFRVHVDEEIQLYALRHAVAHVCEGSVDNQLNQVRNDLLLKFSWLLRKVTEVGPYEAMVDCRTFLKWRAENQEEKEEDRPVKLMKHALQLSLPALYKDPREMASQLVGGRLSMRYDETKWAEIVNIVEEARRWRPKDGAAVWMPTSQVLAPAGNPCLTVLEGHTNYVTSVCWSTDGSNRICSGSGDKTVRVWDAESGQCLTVLEGHTEYVTSVCWSTDGSNRICSGSGDKTVRVWDAESGPCLTVLEGHTDYVTSVCWSTDGSNRICSGSGDKTVRVWDAESGQCLTVLEGHTEYVNSVCWSTDGSNRICSGSWDNTVRVWDAESGQCLTEDHGHGMAEEFKGDIEQPFACRTKTTVGYSIDGNTSPKACFFFDKECQAVRACVRDGKCMHILKLVK